MAVLVPVFLLTDFLRYKPVLVLQSLSHISIWLLLLLGTTLLQMQLMEFFYGITMAARVAYSSYIFSLVPSELYQRVAGYSRSAVLLGVFSSSVLGQLCVSLAGLSFRTLSSISLAFVSFSLLLAVSLPWPRSSMYFNTAKREARPKLAPVKPGSPAPASAYSLLSRFRSSMLLQMLKELRNVVRVPGLRLWCLWWIFNSTGYYLVLFYAHVLWNKVYPATENKKVYNGAVEAASTLLGGCCVLLGNDLSGF